MIKNTGIRRRAMENGVELVKDVLVKVNGVQVLSTSRFEDSTGLIYKGYKVYDRDKSTLVNFRKDLKNDGDEHVWEYEGKKYTTTKLEDYAYLTEYNDGSNHTEVIQYAKDKELSSRVLTYISN